MHEEQQGPCRERGQGGLGVRCATVNGPAYEGVVDPDLHHALSVTEEIYFRVFRTSAAEQKRVMNSGHSGTVWSGRTVPE